MKKRILPIVAAVLVVIAAVVVLLPKGTGNKESGAGNIDENGDLIVKTSELSDSDVTFIRFSGDSKIELLGLIGSDGNAKVALGTCQSCNGSPGAYYTQEGDLLKCNNCGLTFPLSVIEVPGGGCHPIMLDEAGVTETEEGLIISATMLKSYEALFEKVAEH